MIKIDWKAIRFTIGLFIFALLPPIATAALVTSLRGGPQDLVIGVSSIVSIFSNVGLGAAVTIAVRFERFLKEPERSDKVIFSIPVILLAWIIPLILTGVIPVIEILSRRFG
jgi:hypothetical protein